MTQDLAFKILKKIDPERAHDIARYVMRHGWGAPGVCVSSSNAYHLGHVPLRNPLGLAAGFDKNAELIDVYHWYGFGFMEVGSVTYEGGKGNPRPRMFRISDLEIGNRMGLNNDGAVAIARRLKAHQGSTSYGVSIAKTHSPDIVGDKAIRDMVECFKLMSPFGMYTAINLSCPNTKEGKTFEEPIALAELLEALNPNGLRRHPPVLLKLSPTLTMKQLDTLIQVAKGYAISGYICCNTMPHTDEKLGRFGLSGPQVYQQAVPMVRFIRERCPNDIIIGVGGIRSEVELRAYIDAGANACQAYCGYVRGPNAGPNFVHNIMARYDALAKATRGSKS